MPYFPFYFLRYRTTVLPMSWFFKIISGNIWKQIGRGQSRLDIHFNFCLPLIKGILMSSCYNSMRALLTFFLSFQFRSFSPIQRLHHLALMSRILIVTQINKNIWMQETAPKQSEKRCTLHRIKITPQVRNCHSKAQGIMCLPLFWFPKLRSTVYLAAHHLPTGGK